MFYAIYMATRPRARACIFHKTLGLVLYLLLIFQGAIFVGGCSHGEKQSNFVKLNTHSVLYLMFLLHSAKFVPRNLPAIHVIWFIG